MRTEIYHLLTIFVLSFTTAFIINSYLQEEKELTQTETIEKLCD
jgi:hypothetical protein